MMRGLTLCSLAAVLLIGGCLVVADWRSPSEWVDATEEFTVPLDGIHELRTQTRNGAVKIETSRDLRGEALVTAKIRAGGASVSDAERCLGSIVIDSSRSGSRQSLTWRWDPSRRNGWSASVSFTVRVPPGIAIESHSNNGQVSVMGASAGVKASTHNGKIVLRDVQGDVSGETHNGAIEADVSSENVRLSTHNGPITAWLRSNGPLGGSIESHNGQVTVAFAGSPSTRLVCETHNGGISTNDLELSRISASSRSLQGNLSSGDGKLRIETHNGAIQLKKGDGATREGRSL